MKRRWRGAVHCLVGVALVVGLLAYGLSLERRSDQPVTPVRLSMESGFYDSPFYLEMSCDRGEIRYTLDSTEPDENSLLYTQPILIEDASGNPNVYSMIEDVCIELRSDILALSGREPKYGFKTPVEPVDKATVIRAVCIDAFGNRSDIINAVYFVGFDQKEAYDGMNILSITTNPSNLFDFDKGIYVLGKTFADSVDEAGGVPPALPNLGNWAGNYKNKGKEWEREAYICFFDADRNLKLSGYYGIRIQGGASRYMLPKSLNIYARKRYGAETIPAQPLFGEDWQLHSVNLNAGGQGVDTKIHDPLVNTLAAECDFLTREYEPYELFLDGEFWGVYWLTPRFKKDYFESKYGIRDGDVIETKVDHIEVGMIHITDSPDEWNELEGSPFLDYVFQLKKEGKIKHIGVSSHNAEVALMAAKSGWIEVIMFSLNPAFDRLRGGAIPWEEGAMDNLQGGIDPVRVELYDYCATHHIGITVMKTFGGGGRLLDEKTSPLGVAFTPEQCIAYCLAKPCIATCILGVDNTGELKADMHYLHATEAEKDYFEMNARTIITVWGDTYRLTDYANRDYDGLVETFYKVRWQKFFDAVLAAYDAGQPFVNMKGPNIPKGKTKEECERAMKFDAEIWDFENKWAHIR